MRKYKVYRDEEAHLYVLFREEKGQLTKVMEHHSRRKVYKIYKQINFEKEPKP